MRVAFYAPMKPPDHPTPSGDRRVARALIDALHHGGHQVLQPIQFRSYDRTGDRKRQQRIKALGTRLAHRVIRRLEPAPPEAWLSYRVYHKSPDWIGPIVTRAFGIPYLIAEASHAPKRAGGPWDIGFQGARDAIAGASMLLGLNSADTPCVASLLNDPHRLMPVAPFIDPSPHLTAAACRWDHRYRFAALYGLDPAVPWLVSVAMMRPGAKLASYRVLGETLAWVQDLPWSLLVIGDGPARAEVHAALTPVAARVHWLGQIGPSYLPAHLAAADIKVWPAVDEAFGMAILEAQAAGIPVVAGAGLGVGDLVCHGVTGLLAPSPTKTLALSLAQDLRRLLTDYRARAAMGARAIEKVARRHSLAVAATVIDRALVAARQRPAPTALAATL